MDERLTKRRRGWWLRVARERTGMSQADVARALGLVTGTSLVHWEKGNREPSITQLTALAALYGVPVAIFMQPGPTAEERLDDLAIGRTA